MNIMYGLLVCLSMYSAIPTPKVDWNKHSMKYSFCFLPLIGVIIGLLEYFWYIFCYSISLNIILYCAISCIIPVVVTGGLHIDGFIDSCDAIFSYGDKQKRLEILKDPHVGAFGVIYCIVYFIVMFGVFSEITLIKPIILVFAISRTIGALITICWKSSKSSGLKHIFSENTNKKPVLIILLIWLFALFFGIGLINIFIFILILISLPLFYVWFYFFVIKTFDGITGDLVGFSICISELIIITAVMLGGILLKSH